MFIVLSHDDQTALALCEHINYTFFYIIILKNTYKCVSNPQGGNHITSPNHRNTYDTTSENGRPQRRTNTRAACRAGAV